jgi:septum formation protein
MQFILASSSINRKKLLERLKIKFSVHCPIGEEIHDDNLSTSDLVCQLSEQKIDSIWGSYVGQEKFCLMGFDSMVSLDGMSIGKAHSLAEAKKMIQSFVGKKQQIISGVCLRGHDGANFFSETFAVPTDVYFRSDITEEEIDAYLTFDDWQGKCGAYSILGTGIFFVEKIEGSFQNIVGIPIEALGKKLYDLTGVKSLQLFAKDDSK